MSVSFICCTKRLYSVSIQKYNILDLSCNVYFHLPSTQCARTKSYLCKIKRSPNPHCSMRKVTYQVEYLSHSWLSMYIQGRLRYEKAVTKRKSHTYQTTWWQPCYVIRHKSLFNFIVAFYLYQCITRTWVSRSSPKIQLSTLSELNRMKKNHWKQNFW